MGVRFHSRPSHEQVLDEPGPSLKKYGLLSFRLVLAGISLLGNPRIKRKYRSYADHCALVWPTLCATLPRAEGERNNPTLAISGAYQAQLWPALRSSLVP
jgi:hypothetical protein